MAGGLLCLDLATLSGWAYADPDVLDQWPLLRLGQKHPCPDRVKYGTVKFAERNHGKLGHEYETWLRGMIVMTEPHQIIFEAPLPKDRQNANVVPIAWGMKMITETTAYRARMKALTVDVGTVKLSFTGFGHSLKPAMIAKARQMGFNPKDDNDADALAVMHHAAVEFWPALRRHAA